MSTHLAMKMKVGTTQWDFCLGQMAESKGRDIFGLCKWGRLQCGVAMSNLLAQVPNL